MTFALLLFLFGGLLTIAVNEYQSGYVDSIHEALRSVLLLFFLWPLGWAVYLFRLLRDDLQC